MKKTLIRLGSSLLITGAAQSATTLVDLDFAAASTYTNADAQVVTTTVTIGATGSFDIHYTLGSTANNTDPLTVAVVSNGSTYGVTSDTDIAAHNLTAEANDNEGYSFLNLNFDNFVAGDSGLTAGDITNLRWRTFTATADGNNQDGVNISYNGFNAVTTSSQNLSNLGGSVRDLTALANYSENGANLYIIGDNNNSSNRWGIGALQVSFDNPTVIPEPSSTALLGLGGLAMILRRRKV